MDSNLSATRSPASLLWLLLVLLAFASPALADAPIEAPADDPAAPPAWNDARATQLAQELAAVLEEARARGQNAPPQETVLQQRKRDAAQGSARRATEAGAAYAKQMREGADRALSERYFRAVVVEIRSLRATADDVIPAEDVEPLLDRMDEILDELGQMYRAP
jgi:hypothetical protein